MMQVLRALDRAYPGNRRIAQLYDEVATLKKSIETLHQPISPDMITMIQRLHEYYPYSVSRDVLQALDSNYSVHLHRAKKRGWVEYTYRNGFYRLTAMGHELSLDFLNQHGGVRKVSSRKPGTMQRIKSIAKTLRRWWV